MNASRTHDLLLTALRTTLRQLSRLLIHTGIRFDEFAEVVRGVYIESEVRDCTGARIQSRARVAAVTGLTESQVNRYVDYTPPPADLPSADLLVEILQRWHTTPEYVGPYGIPRELDFAEPPERCFCSLVTLADPQANPRAALQELRRAGAVTLIGDSRLRALSRSFLLTTAASPQLIEYFGTILFRFADTMEYNMRAASTEKRLQRRVVADHGLPLELVAEFEEIARRKAMDFLLELDNWLAVNAAEVAHEEERVDAGVNVFLYLEPRAEEPPLAAVTSRTLAT